VLNKGHETLNDLVFSDLMDESDKVYSSTANYSFLDDHYTWNSFILWVPKDQRGTDHICLECLTVFMSGLNSV
jgi:hypothetical protein